MNSLIHLAAPFNPDDTTRDWDAPKPVKELPAQIQYQDINGGKHSDYGTAYRASIKAKLAKIIRENRGGDGYGQTHKSSEYIAEEILKELTVSWN